MSNTLHRLVYCSRNTIGDSPIGMEAEIRQILAASRRNNPRDGVTGALLFSDGVFAQTLEGPLAAVERTFERIQVDPRHAEVAVLSVEPAAGRMFAEWSMGFAGVLAAGAHPLAKLRLEDAFKGPAAASRAGDDVLDLLRDLVREEDHRAA